MDDEELSLSSFYERKKQLTIQKSQTLPFLLLFFLFKSSILPAMDIEELIPITQEKLGSIFKKPKLTPKLLKKPPFRFLFDVIFAVIQETGFLADLYSAEESDIVNINSKDDKMAFLDKLIGAVEARQVPLPSSILRLYCCSCCFFRACRFT